jgi:two-component system aerobic respiration control sensor histidine kinase ArcB
METIIKKEKKSSQLKLLLIEDNILAQKAAELMLTSFNCKVDTADCGEQALKLFAENKYDLTFLDLGLPDLSGFEVAAFFRKVEQDHHRVPIIALTAQTNDEIEKKCFDAGIDTMLSKPLLLEKARELIDYYASVST